MSETTIQQLKQWGSFLQFLGEEKAGPWWQSHCRRYLWFASRRPYYHNCQWAKKTKSLFERLELEGFLLWLESSPIKEEFSQWLSQQPAKDV